MEQVTGGASVDTPLSAAKHDGVDASMKTPAEAATEGETTDKAVDAEGEATNEAAAAVRGAITGAIACLVVHDMPASLAFYVGVLGFKLCMGVDADRQMTATDASAWPSITFAYLSGTGNSGTASDLMMETRNTEHPMGRAAGDGSLGKGMAIYLKGPDPDEVATSLPSHVHVLQQPHTQWYGSREVTFADPVNGYTVTVGKHLGQPCPFEGQGSTDGETK